MKMTRVTVCVVMLAAGSATLADERQTGEMSFQRVQSKLFRHQYTVYDREFCGSEVCVDFDNDGRRELLYASRAPGKLQMLNAADGSIRWTRSLKGEQQSTSAFDLDGDGHWEVLYTVSDPGLLYVCDHAGQVLRQWDSGDNKLGNSPVVIDGDGDDVLDGYFGTRQLYLTRLNMSDLALLGRRGGWVQCGCYTSAMDVDRDGRWDLFAGSGDDFAAKGVLHRLNPATLESVWSFPTDDNASSADAVLVDIDGDGRVEIIKSIDNYKKDDGHDGVMAFTTDGERLWKVDGLSGEDSPNVADLDGDGSVEIVGMTFGGEVYCLDAQGHFKWRRDLRPELDDGQHMYMTPILCDLNGDRQLEILAMTHGQYSPTPGQKPNAKLFALDVRGNVLDELDLGESRYWGHAFVCNLDDDSYLELVVSGYGGLDVIETRGFGSNTEHFQRRRNYQRLNVRPWAYEDSFFIERGERKRVVNLTDNLVLAKGDGGFARDGRFVTELLTLPPDCEFRHLRFVAEIPAGTQLGIDVLAADERPLREAVRSGTDLRIGEPVRLSFGLSTTDPTKTPKLDSYSLVFDRGKESAEQSSRVKNPSPSAAIGQSLVVEAGKQPRIDAPASIALTIEPEELRSVRLVEVIGAKERPIPSQIEPGTPPRLWWIVRGDLSAGAKRTYRIDTGAAVASPEVSVDRRKESVVVRVGESSVLQYNSAHVEPLAGVDAKYGRSAFIHPLWTPAGTVVTDQFPPDHLHQSGIYLAHTKTEFQGRTPNFWDLLGGTGRVRFKSVKSTTSGPIFGEFRTEHEHVDLSVPDGKVALVETWNVRIWNVGGRDAGFWLCDLTSILNCATPDPLRLLKYHYGGMALRGARSWDAEHARFVTSEGKNRVVGNHTRPRWCDLFGPVGDRAAGIAFLTHPANFRAPEPLRIHPTMPYMVYSPSHLGDWEITPGTPHVARYEFVVHDDDLSEATTNRLWLNFAEPLIPSIVQASLP
ncbi:MAG: PmoA family protein [Planctomycetota bacterium]|nr:PmoA family protein [Planctomycetota bacterium]